MASMEEPEEEHISNKEKREKPKNRLDCSIACVTKRSRLNPFIKRTRVRAINIFEIKPPEYQSKSTTKQLVCPKCMGNMEITVRPEKASFFYHKLLLLVYVIILIGLNVWLQQQEELSSNMNTILQINGIALGGMIGILVLVILNTYLKTNSLRPIRLKIKSKSSMAHKLTKARRTEVNEKKHLKTI